MKIYTGKILVLLFISLALSCSTQRGAISFLTNENEKIYKSSTCNPEKPFPQMIMVPFFKRASQLVPNCNTHPKHKTAMALMVFYHHWLEYFGDEDLKVKNMLEQVMITWGLEKRISKKSYNLHGMINRGRRVIGLAMTDTTIWVWKGYFHKISESSLMHELVHLSLRARIGHGDSDHEGSKYDGWTSLHSAMILEAKETLRSFDI